MTLCWVRKSLAYKIRNISESIDLHMKLEHPSPQTKNVNSYINKIALKTIGTRVSGRICFDKEPDIRNTLEESR